MKRRDALKKLGVISLLGSSAAIAACVPSSPQNDVAVEEAVETEAVVEEVKSERDALIVNRQRMQFADPENPTKAELKHTPQITISSPDDQGFVNVDVVVGMQGIIHPATAEHWIDYLSLFINDNLVAHIENENTEIRGAARFWVKLNKGDRVSVDSGCNLHGIWSSEVVF